MGKILIKSFLIILFFFVHLNISHTTSWWVDSSWCHNSSEGYHCHNDWETTTNYDSKTESTIELSDKVQTWETYNNIIRH